MWGWGGYSLKLKTKKLQGVIVSHNIYQNKFISFRQPAWHRLGQVIEEKIGAVDAYNQIGGFELVKKPLFAEAIDGTKLLSKKKALVSQFTDQEYIVGVCDTRYDIIQPLDVMRLWDMVTKAHVETIGILSDGQHVFLSTVLPSYEVRGDEIGNYLLIHLPSVPGHAASVTITPVRVVCQNTLSWGLADARESYKVAHYAGALNRLGKFLQEAWESAKFKSEAVQQAMQVMAEAYVREDQVESYVNELFPLPEAPAAIEMVEDKVNEKRDDVIRLFQGGATGADTEAFQGTAFGLYNSVVEYIDYHSRFRGQSVVFGQGANLKQKAFDQAMELVGK